MAEKIINDIPDYFIKFLLPLNKITEFDTETFGEAYNKRWNETIVCEYILTKKIESAQIHELFVSNKLNSNLLIRMSLDPIDKELCLRLMLSALHLNEKEASKLLKHHGYMEIEYITAVDNIRQRVDFVCKLLLSLLKYTRAPGYMNKSALVYRPASWLKPFHKRKMLSDADLFLLSTTVHLKEKAALYTAHTHGMEQFNLPDILIKYIDYRKTSYYLDAIHNMALYGINKRVTLGPGDTTELCSDGTLFDVLFVEKDPFHPFGKYGAIELKERIEEL
ncbi:MAG: hypothetical protein A2Y62_08920 [Candidatus Fischerbacteria bacterium RBG_13_37_8]|uniref:Uncharacterized protein n=1 Tax=Candidatus Fischerbacteria bacterium RBG_13_37_8 TaxID=1817863 RepID=A0A1F5VUG6_9BACT|nr:MAG: hypothetical protein A2Y62_08920 [Candidatus Fischerbacteria bacterium RBG_13_37_8]